MKKTLLSKPAFHGYKLKVELDRSQVFPTNPGRGTPAVVTVIAPNGSEIDSGTLDYVLSEQRTVGGYSLTPDQIVWLDSVQMIADRFLYCR